MKALLLNGSPRKGNTRAALDIAAASLGEYKKDIELETIDVAAKDIKGCIACESCKSNGGNCVFDDEGGEVIEKIVEADIILFGTPVYWWGITAQLKLVIDRMYSKGEILHRQNKKVGVIAIGEASLDDKEYELINGQFQCICDYLGWEYVSFKGIKAASTDDLIKDNKVVEELKSIGKFF